MPVSLLAGDAACTSWITAPVASVCLYGWGLENTSLETHANAHCYEGLLVCAISLQTTVLQMSLNCYNLALSRNACGPTLCASSLLTKTCSLNIVCHYGVDNKVSLCVVVLPNVGQNYANLLSKVS